ncbi:MAG: hypothetical protein HQL24_07620 [Candidatus Omnitrophica bacterium]|nr:hypothetical protein [Candidatus Omnitrophota bacterium]
MRKPLMMFFAGFVAGIIFSSFVPEMMKGLKCHASSVNSGKKTTAPNVAGNIFSTFEGHDVVSWDGTALKIEIVSNKFCAEGKCLEVVYPKGGYPGLEAKNLPADWSGFDTLKFEVFNPENFVVNFGVLIKDIPGGHSYANRYDGQFAFKPGMNDFSLDIKSLKTNNKSRPMDIHQVMDLVIFLVNPGQNTTLYFDNIRLEKSKSVKAEGSNTKKKSFSKNSGIFSSFEGDDPVGWSGVKNEVVSDENCASGKCLKVTYPKKSYPGLSSKNLPSDWSGYDTLKFDVFNPSSEVVKFGILIKDVPGGHNYVSRYDGQFAFKPGKSQFILNITGLKTNDKSRNIDITQIMELVIFLINPDKETVLYFDNIRLDKSDVAKIGGMKCFDFGKESSPVWPGFGQVTDKTAYSKDLGFGWENIWGLRAEDRQYPDPLFRDWVLGGGPFKVDVENGDYVVYIMLEDPGFWEYYQNYTYRKVMANGKIVIDEAMSAEKFFKEYYYKNLSLEDKPGEDIFNEYIQKRFVWRRFEVKVEGGQLSLSFDPANGYANTVSALIVAPLNKDGEVQKFLKELDKERKEFIDATYVETSVNKEKLSTDLAQKFAEKSFIPFIKDFNEPLLPYDTPNPSQINNIIKLAISQGEYEPFVLGFYPLKKDGSFIVKAEDLVSENGQIFSAENIRIRTVQYKLKLSGSNVYAIRGELLRDIADFDGLSGLTRYQWITVHVPNGTPPGTYKGKIKIYPYKEGAEVNAAAAVGSFDVEAKVLPFELSALDIPIGLFYAMPPQYDWYEETKTQRWSAIEGQLKDIRDHGMNTLALSLAPKIKEIDPNGDASLDSNFFDEFLHVYKHFGFDKPISGYGLISVFKHIKERTKDSNDLFNKALVSAFKQINNSAKDLTGNEILIGLADEVSNSGGEGIDSIKNAAGILKDAGLNVTGYFNGKNDKEIFPYLKTATINNGLGISESLLKYAQEVNTDIWFYNIGQDRFSFGYYLWKTKAKGRVQWHYQLPAVDPYFDLDGRESDYCASYPSFQGPINAVWFELAREGIDDYRYIKTLEKLIESTVFNESNLALRNEANNLLKEIDDNLSVELSKKLPVEKFNQYRAKISEMIEKIYTLKP